MLQTGKSAKAGWKQRIWKALELTQSKEKNVIFSKSKATAKEKKNSKNFWDDF